MSGSAAYRGVVRLGAPLVPFFAYAWLWAAFDSTSGALGALVLFLAMLALIGGLAVLSWRRTDAMAARLGGLGQVWAFRRSVRSGSRPAEAVDDDERWRTETARQLRSTDTQLAGAPWLWVLTLPFAAPVVVAWAAGWEAWHLPAFTTLTLLIAWPVAWWETARRRDRLRRLASQLG